MLGINGLPKIGIFPVTNSVVAGGGGGGVSDGQLVSAEIEAEGYSSYATIKSFVDGGSHAYDPNGTPKVTLSVSDPSHDGSGNGSTINRTIYGLAAVRKPYPNESTNDETESGGNVAVRFALSSHIYAGTTINSIVVGDDWYTDDGAGGSLAGAVATNLTSSITNNSTLDYPKPLATWLNLDREWCESSTFTARLCLAHWFAQQGQPVRAVKFIATDQSANTTSTTVSSPSSVSYSASGLTVPCFSGDLDFSGLVQGDLVTVDAIIYPWVGDAYQISVDGSTYPSPNLTTLRVLNDRTGGYGKAYAYVDPTGGNNGTAVVSATPATAAASPYQTIAAAVDAIQVFNNSTYSRNNTSGGIVRLVVDTTPMGSINNAVGEIPLIVESVDSADVATTILQVTTSVLNGLPDYVLFRNLTFQKNGGSIQGFDGANHLQADGCQFDINGQSVYAAFFYRNTIQTFRNCSGDDMGQADTFGTTVKQSNIIGCDMGDGSGVYNTIGSKVTGRLAVVFTKVATAEVPTGAMVAFNSVSQSNSSQTAMYIAGHVAGARGAAFVGNVVESYGGTSTSPSVQLYADADLTEVLNLVEQQNTFVGERSNITYQDTGTTKVIKRLCSKNSLHTYWNTKSDLFGTPSGNRTGNWGSIFKCDISNYAYLYGGNNGSTYIAGSWMGENEGINPANGSSGTPLVADFVDDQSYHGSNGGGGDYTPGASHALPSYASTDRCYHVDLFGTTIPTDGSALVGAVQP